MLEMGSLKKIQKKSLSTSSCSVTTPVNNKKVVNEAKVVRKALSDITNLGKRLTNLYKPERRGLRLAESEGSTELVSPTKIPGGYRQKSKRRMDITDIAPSPQKNEFFEPGG